MMKDQTLKQIQEDAARQAIIDTARKIIIQQGAGNLSIRTLAKAVGCSPATIYKYFQDKEAILEAIRQEGWRLMGELNEAHDFGGLSPIEALKLSEQNLPGLSAQIPRTLHAYVWLGGRRPHVGGIYLFPPQFSRTDRDDGRPDGGRHTQKRCLYP